MAAEVTFTVLSKTEVLIVDSVEHDFLSFGDKPMMNFTFREAFKEKIFVFSKVKPPRAYKKHETCSPKKVINNFSISSSDQIIFFSNHQKQKRKIMN